MNRPQRHKPKIRIRRPRIRIRWKKQASWWAIAVAFFLFISLFISQLWILRYAQQLLAETLSRQISFITDGKYGASFEEISIQYTSRQLTIRDFHLSPTDTNNLTRLNYEVRIPEIRLQGISFRKLYFNNVLEIGNFNLQQPHITVKINLDSGQTQSAAARLEEHTRKLLPQALDRLKLEGVRIHGGQIEIQTLRRGHLSRILGNGLYLDLGQFSLSDSLGSELDISQAYLSLDSIQGSLSDSLYALSLGSLHLSAADSSLYLRNLAINPQQSPAVARLRQLPPDNLYTLSVPNLYLYGLSLDKLIESDSLEIEELQLISPTLELVNLKERAAGERESFKPENLYEFLEQSVVQLFVGTLSLKEGELRISQWGDSLKEKLHTQLRQVQLHNFQVDSLAAQARNKLFYSDSLDVQLQDSRLRLSDGLHELSAQAIHLNSASGRLDMNRFQLAPHKSLGDTAARQYYNSRVNNLKLQGVDFLTAYHENILKIDSISLQAPRFYLTQLARPDTLHRLKQAGGPYELISGYLYALQVKKLQLNQGIADILLIDNERQELVSTKLSELQLWNFVLDSTFTEKLRPFYADDFRLRVNDYQHTLSDNVHQIAIDAIELSTLENKMQLRKLHIRPKGYSFPYQHQPPENLPVLIELEIPQLQIEGFDLLSSYLRKNLYAEEVIINQPSIRLGFLAKNQKTSTDSSSQAQALYSALSPYLETLQINKLQLRKGDLQIVQWARGKPTVLASPEANITISDFQFNSETANNPRRLFFAEDLRFELHDFKALLRDDVHMVIADRLSMGTQSGEIRAELVRIQPRRENFSDEELQHYGAQAYLNLQVPVAHVQGIDFARAYYEDELEIDSIYAEQPFAELTHLPYRESTTRKPGKDREREIDIKGSTIYAALLPYFENISVAHTLVYNGNFSAYRLKNNQSSRNLSLEGISLLVDNFQVGPERMETADRFLYSDNLQLNIRHYQFHLGDSLHVLQARDMQLSTREKSIAAKDILLHAPLSNRKEAQLRLAGEQNLFFVHLPTLNLENIDFDEIYREEVLRIGILELNRPELRISHYKARRKKKPKNIQRTPFQLIEGALKRVQVDRAMVFNAKGQYTDFNKNPLLQISVDDFDAEILDFRLDENSSKEDARLLFSEDVILNLRNFVRPLADSLHQIRIKSLRASSRAHRIELQDFYLEPRPLPNLRNRLQAQQKHKLLRLHIPAMQLNAIALDRIQQDTLGVKHIAIEKPHLQILSFQELENSEDVAPSRLASSRKSSLQGLLYADSLSFQDGEFEILSISKSDTSDVGLGKLRGYARKLAFDSTSFSNDPRQLLTEEIQLQANDYQRIFGDSLYRLHIDRFGISSAENKLWADSVRIYPIVAPDTFALRKGVASDQFSFKAKRLELRGLDLLRLFGRPSFKADLLLLDGYSLNVYRDKRYPFNKKRRPPLPQWSFRQLGIPFTLDSVLIRNGSIRYAERVKKAREEGYVLLEDFRVQGSKLSNVQPARQFRMDVSFLFMGNSRLDAHFDIAATDTLARHRFYGSVDRMALQDFNPILENTSFVRLRSGVAEEIEFDIFADQKMARGEMRIEYDDLKVALLRKRTGDPGGIFKGIGTAVANLFVQSSSSKNKEKSDEEGKEFKYERDPQRSIINYWVKSLLEGFKKSVGI